MAESQSRRQRALTLVEMMITMSIFGMVVAGFIALQLFGLSQGQLVESKLGASDQSRKLLERMGWEIRSAKEWEVGNVSGTTFSEVANGQLLRGNAIRIYPQSNNTNKYVQYYFNTGARTLLRKQSGVAAIKLVAGELTNNMAFQAEDYRGVVLTNATDSRIWRNCIRVIMEFAQYQYPLTQVGPGNMYDYYKLEYRVAPHCPTLP
jgi:prepilin-type N-terminal cleavage/methylation domain-containing protein